jgi:SAM-dependent methyltransferase
MEVDFRVSRTGRKIRKDSFEAKNDMNMVVKELKSLYLDYQLSTNQIPKIFKKNTGINITSGKCYEIIERLGILRSKSESVSLATSTLDYSKSFLTDKMKAILDGIIIGDGTINANKNTKVARVSISGSQKEFISYCKNLLSPYDACEPYFTPSDGRKDGVGIWTTRSKFHPDIYTVYKKWYDDSGYKDVPKDVSLDPISIMLWYLGDGSLSSRSSGNSLSMYFSTNSFSEEAIQQNLSDRMQEMGFLTSRITKDNRLFIKTSSIVPLLKYMGGEPPVKCYSYKFKIDEWRKKTSMKEASKLLNLDYGKLANWVKSGFVNHSRSPGGKKVLFSDKELDELKSRLSSGELSREKHKKAKARPKEEVGMIWESQITKKKNESEDEYLSRMANIYIQNGFPYKRYSKSKLQKEWFNLRKSQYIIPDKDTIKYRRNGLSFADFFHPHLFSLNRKNKISPVDLFNNKEMLVECLKRNKAFSGTLTYAGLHSAICSDVRSPRLNNFPPLIARDLYNYYCKNEYNVLDFCSGFGGRLIGSSISKRNISYTGIEPSKRTYKGLVDTQLFINKQNENFKSKIINGCAEEELLLLRDSSFDFCFTSPPYFDTEEYDVKDTQSFIRFNSYDLWRENFLRVSIQEVYRVLRSDRYFAINVGKFGKHCISDDIEEIAKEVGFKLDQKKNIAFPIYGFTKSDNNFRMEPLLIFRKL